MLRKNQIEGEIFENKSANHRITSLRGMRGRPIAHQLAIIPSINNLTGEKRYGVQITRWVGV